MHQVRFILPQYFMNVASFLIQQAGTVPVQDPFDSIALPEGDPVVDHLVLPDAFKRIPVIEKTDPQFM